jgi:hypothetical protein
MHHLQEAEILCRIQCEDCSRTIRCHHRIDRGTVLGHAPSHMKDHAREEAGASAGHSVQLSASPGASCLREQRRVDAILCEDWARQGAQ